MIVRARSTPNIALIKYWGNRNDSLRLPMADSLSITLDKPLVEVAAQAADKFSVKSFQPNGEEIKLSEKEISRLERHFNLSKEFLTSTGAKNLPSAVALEIRSQVPRGVGIASSAAVFSAIAEAYSGFVPGTSSRDISVFARLGSGSASRSIYGGFVAMIAGKGDTLGASYAEQIAPADHWRLWNIIIAPSIKEKKTGSTEGHALAATSPLYEKRIQEIGSRQERCVDAILRRDFAALQKVSEEDCMDMHEVMRTSNPPLEYLSAETYRIIDEIKKLRSEKDLPVLYTMDAGPTVHLICEESALTDLRKYAQKQKDCFVLESTVGNGSTIL